MTPASILHRYRIEVADLIAQLIPDACGPRWVHIDGDAIIIDIERPCEATQPAAEAPPSAEPPKGGKLAQRAAMLCAQGGFRAFLGAATEIGAAEILRQDCGIDSRAELDHNDAAAQRFREIEARYDLWLKGYD